MSLFIDFIQNATTQGQQALEKHLTESTRLDHSVDNDFIAATAIMLNYTIFSYNYQPTQLTSSSKPFTSKKSSFNTHRAWTL